MSRNLVQRIELLEKQVARLQQVQDAGDGRAWLTDLYGAFKDDPIFEQAMKLGSDYRKSLRPKTHKRPKRQ